MKRSIFTKAACAVVAAAAIFGLASCGKKAPAGWGVDNSGTVVNIYCWNDEWRGFFNRYVSDEGKALLAKGQLMDDDAKVAKTGYHIDGVPVVFTENPSSDGVYQNALDLALDKQATADANDKIDLFLAEADYILKYTDDDCTQDVTKLGVTDFSNCYTYTVQASSDSKGVVKGVSFQCAPSGTIYNRVIARDVWGTDDPVTIGAKLDTWAKFEAAAAEVKAKGYKMTGSEADTYRIYSNNTSAPWVDAKGNLKVPAEIVTWMDQAESFLKKGYTQTSDVWGTAKTAAIAADANEAFCTFGPAWYYNFCMGGSKAGDWGLTTAPQGHFWGGTWLLAAAGSDNTDIVAKIMNAFINDETVCEALIKNESQFTNNIAVNERVANAADFAGNAFLGGQNDTKMFLGMAKTIVFKNQTIYDQLCNEGLQKYFREYLDGVEGVTSRDVALANFYQYIKTKYPNLKTPK